MAIHINLYFENGLTAPKAKKAYVGYILEYATDKGPATATKFEELHDVTIESAAVQGLIKALEHKWATKSDQITVYTTEKCFVEAFQLGHLERWIREGWKTSRGTERKNRDLWEALSRILTKHEADFNFSKDHSYKKWLLKELNKRKTA